MSDTFNRDKEPWWLPLTRRTFLKASGFTVVLGGAYLSGLNAPISPAFAHDLSEGLPRPVVPQGLGVNVHFDSATTTDAQIAQLASAGFKYVRMDLTWDRVEQQKGQYDFSSYTRLIRALAAHGIRTLCILDYNNALYETLTSPPGTVVGPHTDEVRQAFARFAAAAVTQFKHDDVVWEIWNEPDYPRFWQPQPNPVDYMALAQVTIAAMRQADRHATIVAPALTGLEPQYQSAWDYLTYCFSQGLIGLVDAISVHPYRLGPPESALVDYQRLRALISQFEPVTLKPLPIISSEWGYSLTWVSKEQQAAYFVRLYLLNLLAGFPMSTWYDWQDDGPDTTQIEQNFGVIDFNGQPKLPFYASQTLTHELRGFHFDKRVSLASDNDFALLFRKDGEHRWAVWTSGDAHTVTLKISCPSVTVTSMTGEKSKLPTKDGKLEIALSGDPQYLTGRPG